MNLIIGIIWIIHILLWVYVIIGPFFVSKKMAKINLFIILPMIYLIHTILPRHFLNYLKGKAAGAKNTQEENQAVNDQEKWIRSNTPMGYWFSMRDGINKWSAYDPLGAQGMVILAFIINVYRVYYPDYPFKS